MTNHMIELVEKEYRKQDSLLNWNNLRCRVRHEDIITAARCYLEQGKGWCVPSEWPFTHHSFSLVGEKEGLIIAAALLLIAAEAL